MLKAQVTAFIILGILIVAVIGAAFYFRDQLIRTGFEAELEKAAIVPAQIQPVKLFIDRCVQEVSSDAINLIAFQGGYLRLKEDNLPVTIANPFSNALRLNSRGDQRVAYWSYQTANGLRVKEVPSQEDIEDSIGSYLTVNLNDCLDGLDIFGNEGYNITRNAIGKVDARILDNNVQVIVEQPVIIRYKDIDFTIEKHLALIKKPFGRFYELAKQLLEREESSYFLEEKTIDMLVVHDELPFSDTDVSCQTRIWTKSKVESDFKTIAEDNIAALRVEDSNYQLTRDNNGYFELDGLNGKYKDVSITFRYSKNWPSKLEINPSDGELLKGSSINHATGNDLEGFLTSLFCISDYHFIYDIKYPVLVTLSNDDFNFQYAIQVSIDNNQPRENLLGEEQVIEANDEICNNKADARIIIDTVAETPRGEIVPINDVNVKYKCITSTCDIGSSINGRIEGNLPACLNGVAIGEKEGYGVARTVVSSSEPTETSLVLKPKYTRRIDVRLIDKDTGEVRMPFESEQVVFEFIGDGYSTSIVWPGNDEISLIPGSYSVSSYVIGKSTWDIQIAEREIESCTEVPNGFLGVFGSTEEECRTVKVPGTTLEEAVKGGANFNLDVSHSDIAFSNRIELYTMVDKIPGTYDGLSKIYDDIESNALDARFRYPEFRQ